MFRNQMGIIAAMESADNEGVDLNEVESAETATAVSEDTAALTTEATGIDAEAASVGDAVESGEQLEEIAEVATDAVESGEGMDETAAAMASIAIESIRNRLGFRGTQKLVPALESFGNTNTKLVSTRLVIEGIGDTLKRIWTAIKAAAARIWDKIKLFFSSLFSSAGMLSKHIAGLKERARNISSSAVMTEKKMKYPALAKSFSLNGKANFETYGKILKNTVALKATGEKFAEESQNVADAAKALAGKEINEASVKAFLAAKNGAYATIEQAFDQKFEAADTTFSSDVLKAVIKVKKAKAGSSVKKSSYGPFVGSTVLTTEVEKIDGSDHYSISFSGVTTKIAEEVELLELSEIRKVLDEAGTLANQLADFKKTQANMEKITKAINGVADVVISNSQAILKKTGSSTETNLGLAELKAAVSSTISDMNMIAQRSPSLIFAAAKAGADYASVSMRNLGEKKAKSE